MQFLHLTTCLAQSALCNLLLLPSKIDSMQDAFEMLLKYAAEIQ